MLIGEVADAAAGVGVETLRFHEREGLLPEVIDGSACAADETTGECPILDALDEDPETDWREDAWKGTAST